MQRTAAEKSVVSYSVASQHSARLKYEHLSFYITTISIFVVTVDFFVHPPTIMGTVAHDEIDS